MSSHFLKSGTAAPGIIETGGRGRVNVRKRKNRDYYRFRFHPVYPDQAATILDALAMVREDTGTKFDAVALDLICIHFLATFK